ncbi:MAG: peptidylprolyl isomerase [Cyclonatronaceae bacterium]
MRTLSTYGIYYSAPLCRAVVAATVLSTVLILAACSKDPADKTLPVVAEWNGSAIDTAHFRHEYIYFSTLAPFPDNEKTREYYAKMMLERMIIADFGREVSLDTLRQVRESVKRREEMAMRRHYLNQVVRPGVAEPTETEIREAFRRSKTQLNLQQIYASSKREADSLYTLLKQGYNFDRIAMESMQKAGVPDWQNAGHMGWVSFNDFDEEVENAVFSLNRHEISWPIESLRGWHIFRVHDVVETVHFDQSTYQNARDNLKFSVFQRRFNESSARFIRDMVMQHDLAVDMMVLSILWGKIQPVLPRESTPIELARFNREINIIKPEIDNSTPVAFVDGQPYTVGQFMAQIPDIPLEWIGRDFRHALEIAIRDSILAVRAQHEIQADTAPEVIRDRKFAEYAGLYYATLQHASDTLNLARLDSKYYDHWKDEFFVDYRTSWYIQYNFADSLTAVNAVRDFKQTADWQKTLDSLPEGSFTVEQKSATTKEITLLPVHRLPVNDPSSPAKISGPFARANWAVIKTERRETTYKPFDAVQEKVIQLLHDRKTYVVHRELLDNKDFSTGQISLNRELLNSVLPFYK